MKIAVIYGGTRPNGNTETLTELVIKGLAVNRIFLKDYRILPIEDFRHSEGGFPDVDDEYNTVIKQIIDHDILIFATPVYWYSMSGIMKNFIDRWSQTLRDSSFPDFKKQMAAKQAYVVAVGGDAPYIKGLPMIEQFQFIFSFMGTAFAGYILGDGNKPGEVLKDKVAIAAAKELHEKLSRI